MPPAAVMGKVEEIKETLLANVKRTPSPVSSSPVSAIPRAAASPMLRAVPDGASTLCRWCASTISTS